MALININKPFMKIPWSKRAVSYYLLLLLNTFLYTLIFDEPRILLYNYSPKDTALIIICAALFNLTLFFILMLSKWVFVIVNPVLYYFGAVGIIYADKFHIDTNILSAPMFLFHNTITSSISSNFTYSLLITLIFLLGLFLGLIRFFFARDKSTVRRGQAFALIFIISTVSYSYMYNNYKDVSIQPYAFINGAKNYAVSSIINSFHAGSRKDMVSLAKTDDNITGVVILLEKLSSKPLIENTSSMPVISKENIILFNNFKSEFNGNLTTRSAIMTGTTAENTSNYTENTSFMSVIKNAGFNVEYIGIYNTLLAKDNHNYHIIKNDTDNIYEIETNNSPNLFRSISYVSEFIEDNNGGLIVINAEGSAPVINMRYKDFIALNADDEYHNYVTYINAYLTELINQLKHKNAFIIFTGLEGENYSDNISTYDKGSPLMVWVSDSLENKYHTRSRINSHNLDKILDDTIYNTVLSCFELSGSGIKEGSNLCRKQQ